MGKSNELSYDFYFSRAQPAQVESLIKKFNDFVGYPSKVQSYPEAKKGTGRFWDQTIHVAPMSGEGAYDPKAPEYDYLDVADIMQMLAEDEKLTYEMKLLD